MEGHSSTLENFTMGATIIHVGGSLGKVKVATNNLTGKEVAIKIIKRDQVKSMGMEVKVNKEIEMLRLLSNCSNVVKLHNVIETSETVYIVMEYCKNGELFDHLILKGRLSEDEARRIFRQIISGVEYCHRNMVVHCDLTVGNLLLDSDYNVKLANFEFSNIMQDGQFPNAYGGSTMYAAPEVISGAQYIGGEVDVWSCGVVLYALLCGTLPFDSENTTKLHQDIKDCAYTVPGHLTVLARDLIGRMLVVDPKRRITISEVGRHAWLQVRDT